MPAPNPNDPDDAIDKALEEATKGRARPTQEVPLKRQWDDELEAELEAALAGFDDANYDVSSPRRTRAADRAHVPKGGVGKEERPGTQPAKVIGVRGKSVFLDLGAKSEGVVPVEQFGDKLPAKGDVIEVVFDRFDPDEGLLLMSLKGAAVEANWENLRKGMIVEARPTKVVKGGLEVVVDGIRGFMPISQIDLNRVEDGSEFLNQKLRAIVTEADPRERNLVVSRRELLEKERAELREKTWKELEEGQVRTGVVRSLKPFGAFVDLGGVDGLIPIPELGWGRVNDPSEVVKTGQEVQVKVLRIDRTASKVSLSLKQLLPSPWDEVEEKYHRGMTVKGKVTRLMDFGAFVELEPGVEGLIHISELGPKRVYRVKDVVQPDQEVEVRILQIDPDAHKISLSLRPLPAAPAPEPEEAEGDTPPPPKPIRKVPLKGGLGDRDPDPFQK
jgi:ribosomal protein S1